MKNNFFTTIKADFLLLITAFIWGAGFVAQRAAMNYLPPFYFNAVRFLLGSLSLVPFILFKLKKNRLGLYIKKDSKNFFIACITLGLILFCAASLQQIGIVYTTAGKAGFITSLYVILVPIISYLFLRQRLDFGIIIGVIFSFLGLYLLSINSINKEFYINKGDLLIFLCAIMFALHVIFIGYFVSKFDCIVLSSVQFFITGLLSLIFAICLEEISWQAIYQGLIPVLYAGFVSVGVAYTLQLVAQQHTSPSHASIILSLESAFAVLTGYFLLDERLSSRAIWGCVLLFLGMMSAQLWPCFFRRNK
ncbi:MAG: DMT family transporter [Desulfonauticus sp.]|nr:DMT family transporter [Desulfonauticus sp.]